MGPGSRFACPGRRHRTPDTPSPSRGMFCPGFASSCPSLKTEGAGNAGHVRRTRSLVCNKESIRVVTTGSPERTGIPCANGFNGFLRARPGDRALLSPSPARMSRQLDISVGISGPHDFAVRLKRIRLLRRKRPPHPAPNVRDDRDTPLLRRRDRADSAGDLRVRSTLVRRGELARRANQAVIHIPNCTASP
jgi:hypothetical protein